MIGNFIGDAIKGNNYNSYSENIKKGILLHRKIDSFTDTHPLVIKSIKRLRTNYGKYAGIVIDIFYDHFLSVNWSVFSQTERKIFINNTYQTIVSYNYILPDKVKRFLPYMIQNNWLESYIEISSIKNVLNGMTRHTSLPNKTDFAMQILKNNYELFEIEFNAFFSEIIEYAKKELLNT
ncbi:MAG: DUF479 domain-containing protein [Chlorobi bacterium]|nr:DUF479 domain-containing protein [Chlorobiota bacterium]